MPIIKHNNSHYYDIYYHKYFKYKHKYLTLKNKLQKGSGTPLVNHLKFINRINPDHPAYHELEEYLNLIYGFIWNNTGLIHNYYNFYDKNIINNKNINMDTLDYKIGSFIPKIYDSTTGQIKPTNNLMNMLPNKKLSPKDYGHYLCIMFFNKKFDITNNLTNIFSTIHRKIQSLTNLKSQSTQDKLDILQKLESLHTTIKTSLDNLKKKNSILHDYFPLTLFEKCDFDKKIFQICLSTLWWICNDESGISEYYSGINDISTIIKNVFTSIHNFLDGNTTNLPIIKKNKIDIDLIIKYSNNIIKLPDKIEPFSKDELNINVLDKSHDKYFELSLALAYLQFKGIVHLFRSEKSYFTYNNISFNYSDCVETTLRNFINILIFNGQELDTNILKKYNATDNLQEYYRVFKNFDLQASIEKQNIFNQNLTARDAWSLVVSNLPSSNIHYKEVIDNYQYEIKASSNKNNTDSNFISVLQVLFNNEKLSWDYFNEYLYITPTLNENYLGTVYIESKQFTSKYIIYLDKVHHSIDNVSYKKITYNIDEPLYSYINNSAVADNNNFMWINFSNEKLIEYINNINISDDNYRLLFNYTYNKFNFDEKSSIILNFNKLNDISKYNLNAWDIKYDNSGSFNFDNIIEYHNIKNLVNLNKFINLKVISFFIDFNEPLNVGDIPNSVTHLTFEYSFNQPLKVGHIPDSVTHLTFGDSFNQPLKLGVIPYGIIYLTFGALFDQPLRKGHIPNSVTHLTFGYSFDQPLEVGHIPDSVTHLTFGESFNQPLKLGVIPYGIIYLTFGHLFDQPLEVGHIPDSVTHLTFGESFNQPLEVGHIPDSVTHLTFGDSFNQPLEVGYIPNSVTHLIFGAWFNQPLRKWHIPNSVIHLTFGNSFNQPLEVGDIPDSVTHLTFGYSFNQPLVVGHIPDSITHLTFGYNFNQPLEVGNIPDSVTHLTFGYNFNQPLEVGNIPDSVTHLTFGDNFNQPLRKGHIPNSVTHLIFGSLFNQPLEVGDIPDSVTHLTFGYWFNKPLEVGQIPDSVTHLTFGYWFNQPLIKGHIPNSVTHLIFGSLFNQPLRKGHIPNSVTHLTFGYNFNQPLRKVHIPNSVTHLIFGYLFNQPLEVGDIPDSVTHLTFGTFFNQPLEVDNIPDSVTHLTFGYWFNQPLRKGHIPNSVTHLTFGYSFNQPLVVGHIPDTVIHLIFGSLFNQPLKPGDIPTSVKILQFNNPEMENNIGNLDLTNITELIIGSKKN